MAIQCPSHSTLSQPSTSPLQAPHPAQPNRQPAGRSGDARRLRLESGRGDSITVVRPSKTESAWTRKTGQPQHKQGIARPGGWRSVGAAAAIYVSHAPPRGQLCAKPKNIARPPDGVVHWARTNGAPTDDRCPAPSARTGPGNCRTVDPRTKKPTDTRCSDHVRSRRATPHPPRYALSAGGGSASNASVRSGASARPPATKIVSGAIRAASRGS